MDRTQRLALAATVWAATSCTMIGGGRAPGPSVPPPGGDVTAEDVAGVVAFLCTDEAYMIRGQVILVDGGKTLIA